MRDMYTKKIPIKNIHVPDIKIREPYLDDPKFLSLKQSVSKDGIKQNIVVRHKKINNVDVPNEFELADGLQRKTAAELNGWTEILANVYPDMTDNEMQELQFKLNECRLKTKLIDLRNHIILYSTRNTNRENPQGPTVDELCEVFSLDKPEYYKIMRLTNLHVDAEDLVNSGGISANNAFFLATLPTDSQVQFIKEAQEQTAAQFQEYVKQMKRSLKTATVDEAKAKTDPDAIPKVKSMRQVLDALSAARFELGQLKPDDPDYKLYAGRLAMIEELCQVDAFSIATRKKAREVKKLERQAKEVEAKDANLKKAREELARKKELVN